MPGPRTPPRASHCSGNVALEYGLIVPVLLLMVLGLMDMGRLLWTYVTLSRSVEAAARCAAVNSVTCGTEAAIKDYAVAEAWGLNIQASAYSVGFPTCGAEVTATYEFRFVIPWYGPESPSGGSSTLTLQASACYRS